MDVEVNENWNISGIILEGICGSGKTAILKKLLRCPRFVAKTYDSSIVLSEHQTQRVLERKEREAGLTVDDNLGLLDQHVSYLEGLAERLATMHWCDNKKTNMRIPYILERFHFTHAAHYAHVDWHDVEAIDSRLAQLNCGLCLLTIDEARMEQRIIDSRNSGWLNYVSRFGKTNAEIIGHYKRQQDLFLEMAKETGLPAIVLNTTAMSLSEAVDRVLNFWGLDET